MRAKNKNHHYAQKNYALLHYKQGVKITVNTSVSCALTILNTFVSIHPAAKLHRVQLNDLYENCISKDLKISVLLAVHMLHGFSIIG